MKSFFLFSVALFVVAGFGLTSLHKQDRLIKQQDILIDSLKKENKRFDDSLFFIGYNFKENPHAMDSLHFMGYIECFRDEKQKAGFHGW
ncbi:MAG: hypothetical protein WCG20_00760 [bacterium]